MPDEIIYTSAPTGLAAGARGFCVVAASKGISPRTTTLLESLSGYRHLNAPIDGPHPGNPVVFSALETKDGQTILSRIADAGLDYSGRTNKLAHHLLLSPDDQTGGGPSALLANDENLVTQWSGDPRTLSPRTLKEGTSLQGVCSSWKEVSGDAGWAGELAKTIFGGASDPCILVVQPSLNSLRLIEETLSLVPPSDRWRATFSTFYTGLPVGMTCRWKCVIAGSKEHQALADGKRGVVLDLTSPMGMAPDSDLTQAARTGKRESRLLQKPVPQMSPLEAVSPSPVHLSAPSLASIRTSAQVRQSIDGPVRSPDHDRETPKPANNKSACIFVVLVGMAVMMFIAVIAGVGGWWFFSQPFQTPKTTAQAAPPTPQDSRLSVRENSEPQGSHVARDDTDELNVAEQPLDPAEAPSPDEGPKTRQGEDEDVEMDRSGPPPSDAPPNEGKDRNPEKMKSASQLPAGHGETDSPKIKSPPEEVKKLGDTITVKSLTELSLKEKIDKIQLLEIQNGNIKVSSDKIEFLETKTQWGIKSKDPIGSITVLFDENEKAGGLEPTNKWTDYQKDHLLLITTSAREEVVAYLPDIKFSENQEVFKTQTGVAQNFNLKLEQLKVCEDWQPLESNNDKTLAFQYKPTDEETKRNLGKNTVNVTVTLTAKKLSIKTIKDETREPKVGGKFDITFDGTLQLIAAEVGLLRKPRTLLFQEVSSMMKFDMPKKMSVKTNEGESE